MAFVKVNGTPPNVIRYQITYTENDYCSKTSVERCDLKRTGNTGFAFINLNVSSLPKGNDVIEIGKFENANIKYSEFATIASQNGLATLILTLYADGRLCIQNTDADNRNANGFYRQMIPIIFND